MSSKLIIKQMVQLISEVIMSQHHYSDDQPGIKQIQNVLKNSKLKPEQKWFQIRSIAKVNEVDKSLTLETRELYQTISRGDIDKLSSILNKMGHQEIKEIDIQHTDIQTYKIQTLKNVEFLLVVIHWLIADW